MPTDPILDVLRARVRASEPFHASRAEVEHLIEKVDRLLLQHAVLAETVALQKVLMAVRKPVPKQIPDFPVTGEP